MKPRERCDAVSLFQEEDKGNRPCQLTSIDWTGRAVDG